MNVTESIVETCITEESGLPARQASSSSETESSFYYGLRVGRAPALKQILIVEDDPEVRELVARAVRLEGFHADTAQDGEEGWLALRHTAYDLLITDHEMPRLTGLKLIERLRTVSIEPPCILISGNLPGTDDMLMKIVHPGAILEKPFLPGRLMELVYDFLLHGDL